MSHIIKTKEDALGHINALYPIDQTPQWDQTWLDTIESYGIENLPEEILFTMARLMLQSEGESCIIDCNGGENKSKQHAD